MATLSLSSPRTATIDLLRGSRAPALVQVLGIVAFALLAALGAQARLYLWEVPITLQTFAIYGAGLFLGGRNGVLSMLLYLGLGLLLPVYAGGGQGVAYLLSAPSAGYLLGAPLAAAAVGAASARWRSLPGALLALLAGSAVLFACGVAWLHVAAGHATWWESVDKGWLRFVVWDLAKILLLGLGYGGARRLTA